MPNPSAALANLQRMQRGDQYSVDEMVHATGSKSLIDAVEKAVKAVNTANESLDKGVTSADTRTAEKLTHLIQQLGLMAQGLDAAIKQASSEVIGSRQKTDLNPVMQAIDSLKAAIGAIPQTDLTDLMLGQHMLAKAVESIEMADYSDRLGQIEARLSELEKPKQFEFTVERVNSMPYSPIKKVKAKQI